MTHPTSDQLILKVDYSTIHDPAIKKVQRGLYFATLAKTSSYDIQVFNDALNPILPSQMHLKVFPEVTQEDFSNNLQHYYIYSNNCALREYWKASICM